MLVAGQLSKVKVLTTKECLGDFIHLLEIQYMDKLYGFYIRAFNLILSDDKIINGGNNHDL